MCKGTLIAVKNMEESKKFYHDILDMNVAGDFGANVQLDGGLFLQTLHTWCNFISNKEYILKIVLENYILKFLILMRFAKNYEQSTLSMFMSYWSIVGGKELFDFMTQTIIL